MHVLIVDDSLHALLRKLWSHRLAVPIARANVSCTLKNLRPLENLVLPGKVNCLLCDSQRLCRVIEIALLIRHFRIQLASMR
jgi:hypothetical protein